jgi:hypothetical protein
MNYIRYILKSVLLVAVLLLGSCKDNLTEMNVNPNGVEPSEANPNLILAALQSQMSKSYVGLGFGNIGGTVQFTQHDAWNGGHNNYEWGAENWDGWYGMLRNNKLLMDRADQLGWNFHKGVGLILNSFIFGVITDMWGDCPYTDAVRGDEGIEYIKPAYDSQETIYPAIITELNNAIEVLTFDDGSGVDPSYDIFYAGDADMWTKFAGSLLLRYYMRLSAKDATTAWAGIQDVYNSGNYFESAEDDAIMDYVGGIEDDSWPSAYEFDNGDDFRRIRMCTTLLDALDANNDPRKEIWIDKVHCRWIPDPTLVLAQDSFIRKNGELTTDVSITDAEYVESIDNGDVYTRHFHPDSVTYDTGEYVAVPPHLLLTGIWNGNPNSAQTLQNQHVSQLGRIYREKRGDILVARLCSYAEVCFIFSEAALNGASVGGTAQQWYEMGIQGSLDAWDVGDDYDDFILEPGVAYNGTLEQILEQKWIAGWTAGTEAWFDFRRTGLPDFPVGDAADRDVLPLRYPYGDNEVNLNSENYAAAVENLEETTYSAPIGKDSPWSKSWLIQGTGQPY